MNLLPVTPAAHYHHGRRLDGRKRAAPRIPRALGLLARSPSTVSVHGANRLASNSLLEALVFGLRLGAAAASSPRRSAQPQAASGFPPSRPAALGRAERVEELIDELRDVAWSDIGIVRSRPRLERALVRLDEIERELPAGNPTQRSGELRTC